jgi:hypothetical protein
MPTLKRIIVTVATSLPPCGDVGREFLEQDKQDEDIGKSLSLASHP